MKNKILIALQTFGESSFEPLELLKGSPCELVFNNLGHRLSRDEIIKLGHDCEGIIAGVEPYDKAVLDKLLNLKCISRCGVGTDNIDLEEAGKRKIAVLNTPEVVIQPVAEMAIAMIFDLLRNLTLQTAYLKSGQWKRCPGRLLSGKKAGIIGLGRIGKRVAEVLKKLDVEVFGFDLYPDTAWANAIGVKLVSLPVILKYSDIITIHVSIIKENHLFLGKEEIDKIKDGAFIVNTSRGSVIDEGSLYTALKSGKIKGAALDVFSEEPYKGALLGLDNVVLTPHVSTLTEESRSAMEKQAVENIVRFFDQKGA